METEKRGRRKHAEGDTCRQRKEGDGGGKREGEQ